MKSFSYLVYIVFWEAMTIGGSVYLYLWKSESGWWVVLGLILACCAYRPEIWIHGKGDYS